MSKGKGDLSPFLFLLASALVLVAEIQQTAEVSTFVTWTISFCFLFKTKFLSHINIRRVSVAVLCLVHIFVFTEYTVLNFIALIIGLMVIYYGGTNRNFFG